MRSLKIFYLVLIILTLSSCKLLIDPLDDNHNTLTRAYKDPTYAEGLMFTAYIKRPTVSFPFDEVATDDAVINDKASSYLRMATGQWSSQFNPEDQWSNCISAIMYLNRFLSLVDSVPWRNSDKVVNDLFIWRLKGESYALRGLFEYHLLQRTGGFGSDGKLLGIPVITEVLVEETDFNIPRAGFSESVKQIYSDLDKALGYLTMLDYKDLTINTANENLVKTLIPGIPGVTVSKYNIVFGSSWNQRISGRMVKALKARVALLAASPAFSDNDIQLWEKAAIYADAVISDGGGIAGLDPNGHRYYDATRTAAINLASGVDQKEMIWRNNLVTNNLREADNYPPSLFGRGRINPTQNLVDAFPGANGYPISNPLSQFDPANPYAKRDPRLALYILYNGATMRSTKITTGVGGGTNAKDSIETSTRTGYYLRKLLNENVNMNPSATSTQRHYEVHIRFTELFLIYAEAANEAWGPNGTGPNGFSAIQVIAAIRKRAGITQPDNYLTSITTKEAMRDLIRNERRLELCFEGFRFWDLRRWKADLTVPAKGVNINQTGTTFSVVDVEPRAYDNNYMHYGPIPQNEVLKYNAIVQNKGW
jgi:hypothetical protein